MKKHNKILENNVDLNYNKKINILRLYKLIIFHHNKILIYTTNKLRIIITYKKNKIYC